MNNINENELPFWEYVNGKPKILQSKVIDFLEGQGFVRVKLSNTNYVLAEMKNNILSLSTEGMVAMKIRKYLESKKLLDVYEVFAKGVGTYVSSRKLDLLNYVELINDRDNKTSSNFFFKNQYCVIDKDGIKEMKYETLNKKIWESRIIQRDYELFKDSKIGQFEQFCINLTNRCGKRLLALKTILGYLLHRNKSLGEAKATIFYDENMGINGLAHGGTGKTLLCQALSYCREVEFFDGKEVKIGSWFKNQRINLTTDILVYDDLNKHVGLENFFSMITSGIEVEKKRQQAYFIDSINSPKILITSNYVVGGPGGSSDERRRNEFEIANYYDADFTPEMEFKNRFFEAGWNDVEWSKFYFFMMSCVQDYFKHGLLNVEPINLKKNKEIDKIGEELLMFLESDVENNVWIDKRKLQIDFEDFCPELDKMSPHQFTKCLNLYASQIGGEATFKSTGGDYFFKINLNVEENEEE